MYTSNFIDINEEDLEVLIDHNEDILLFDVRGVYEYRYGHLSNSKNIPINELNYQIKNLAYYKNKDIVVYCALGVRSEVAANMLGQKGFNKVYNLIGEIEFYSGNLV